MPSEYVPLRQQDNRIRGGHAQSRIINSLFSVDRLHRCAYTFRLAFGQRKYWACLSTLESLGVGQRLELRLHVE